MLTGWGKIGGYWYYFDPSGLMQTGRQTIDGVEYYLNEDVYHTNGNAPFGTLMDHREPENI